MLLQGNTLFAVRSDDEHEAEAQLTSMASRCAQSVSLLVHQSPADSKIHLKSLDTVLGHLTEAGVDVVNIHSAKGNWSDGILRYAHEVDPSFIFIPAGDVSRTDVRKADTYALSVARHAQHSVWLAKPHTAAIPETILCAVDGRRASAEALRMAIDLCRSFGSRLITAYSPHELARRDVLALAMTAQQRGEARHATRSHVARQHQEFLDEFCYDGIGEPDHRLLWAHRASDALIELGNEYPRALMVLGSAGAHRFFRPMLGTTSNRVLQASPCSLLFVKY